MEDIFSNTKTEIKKCPNPNTKIIIDTREKQSLIAANLIEQKANIEFEKLEIGDYLIGDTLIERKTFKDFVNSIIDKRLIEQLKNMRKHQKPILIIEGFIYNYKDFNMHENAIKGMIISIATDFKIPIIYTESEKDTASFLIITAKRYEKNSQELSIRHSKNLKSKEEQKRFILEGFPGIGPTLSKNLLEEFNSLKEIFNANEKELGKISKFDENKIRNFKELLD